MRRMILQGLQPLTLTQPKGLTSIRLLLAGVKASALLYFLLVAQYSTAQYVVSSLMRRIRFEVEGEFIHLRQHTGGTEIGHRCYPGP